MSGTQEVRDQGKIVCKIPKIPGYNKPAQYFDLFYFLARM